MEEGELAGPEFRCERWKRTSFFFWRLFVGVRGIIGNKLEVRGRGDAVVER
jgi:hypothetical protein